MSGPQDLRLVDRGSVPVAHIGGELDVSSTAMLRNRLLAAVDNQDVGLVIDLSDSTYVDSAGVNLLFEVAERLTVRQLAFAVVYPEGGIVERVFEIVKLSAVADVHHSVDAAVHGILGGKVTDG
jgi:stage II sporulation protein AA (anti-sigma F factor antagonist)